MCLADELIEVTRPHPGGERLTLGHIAILPPRPNWRLVTYKFPLMLAADGTGSAPEPIQPARAAELLPRARRRQPPAYRSDPRDRRRATCFRARPPPSHQPTAHVLASAPPAPRGDRPNGTRRPRGALLVRPRKVRRAQRARLPPPHESRRGASVSHGVVPDRLAEGARAGLARWLALSPESASRRTRSRSLEAC